MSDTAHDNPDQYVELVVEIVSAYVANNSVPVAELPTLIRNMNQALRGLSNPTEATPAIAEAIEKPSPAQIRKSITDEGIVSFLDGKSYKTLKRHLGTHGLDPRSYRQRYGLPHDYPMVAPSYAAQRSALAKSIGLGRPGGLVRSDAPEAATKARGRRKAA